MLTSLSMCGYIELKPSQASMGSLFQMPGFTLPQPSGRGTSIRNIQAFNVSEEKKMFLICICVSSSGFRFGFLS